MARRKKSSGTVRYIQAAPARVRTVYRDRKKRRSMKARRVKHAGITGGLLATGVELLTGNSGATGKNPIDELLDPAKKTVSERLGYVKDSIVGNVKVKENWYPTLGGALITAAPKIPVVSMAAKPVDQAIKTYTKGKWGL
jgi:hypothetical protein